MDGIQGGFPPIDRWVIKSFIESNFKYTDKLNLEGSFGIPISFFVNHQLEVITLAPQDEKSIIKFKNKA